MLLPRLFIILTIALLLNGCSNETVPQQTERAKAVELEGILVTSAAPVVMANLLEKRVYLYFFPMDCDPCWQRMKKAEPYREKISIIGVVMSEDNFAVYERARSYFINLLPIYADHDGNISYDYDVDEGPMWVTVNESGVIEQRNSLPPGEVLGAIDISNAVE